MTAPHVRDVLAVDRHILYIRQGRGLAEDAEAIASGRAEGVLEVARPDDVERARYVGGDDAEDRDRALILGFEDLHHRRTTLHRDYLRRVKADALAQELRQPRGRLLSLCRCCPGRGAAYQ